MLLLLFTLVAFVRAVTLDTSSTDSICEAVGYVVDGEMNYYLGLQKGGTVGMFSSPYYWWNAGEVFGGWVDYWAYCQSDNSTFENILYEAMYHQAGSDYNYMPSNQSMTEGNDDQGVWGMAIMQAVERNFTDPEDHSWLEMAQAIYNTMNNRWDDTSCGGGLRWQIFTWNSGYDYKNSIANGCLFHMAARLYRFTGLEMYLETAEKVWNWMEDVGFMVDDSTGYYLYDGADDTDNCTDLTKHKWSYTYGVFLAGSAYLYNATGESEWESRTNLILDASSYFFNNSIMAEMTCAGSATVSDMNCNNDQRSFRLLFARCLALTASLMPTTYDTIYNYIEPSAAGAAQLCSGGTDGITCGFSWSWSGWDGYYGLGEQISAGETIMSLITMQNIPLTPAEGASNTSDPTAGNSTTTLVNRNVVTIKTKDKAGAAILTAVVMGTAIGGAVWMLF